MTIKKIKNLFPFLLYILNFAISKEKLSENEIKVIINEISTNNNLLDSNGNYSSWIEIYNKGEDLLDISGYGLSNEEYIPLKWTFPKDTIINPGEYLIAFTSDKKSKSKEFHTNFQFKNDGDFLFFSNPSAELIEKIDIPSLKEDESYGRNENNEFQKMIPSPRKKNKINILPPKFSNESGFYDNEFFLTLSSSINAEIYFTIDGTNPIYSNTSIIYKEAIKINDRSGESNIYSEIGDDPESPLYIGH